jgi:hypothetical protein
MKTKTEIEQKDFLGGLRNLYGKNEKENLPKFRIATSRMKVINTCGVYEDYDELLGTYCHPTLKDLAIFLHQMCGQGVMWRLSDQLSKRTGFDLKKIDKALHEIVEEYANMSDEDALEDWKHSKGFSDKLKETNNE